MPFLQFTFEVGSADPAPLEEALFAHGALSVALEDAADDPILEPAPGALPLWPTVRIKALFAETEHDLVRRLQADLDALPPYRVERLEDRVWEREWLKDFRPMRFGRRLWVCPAGQRPDEPDAVVVDLDPGLAFGTGTHPTTALCLEWLDEHAAKLDGKSLLDYGCGSGILAIAALKLGAARAQGMDIDPQAVLASRDNAARNRVSERLALTLEPDSLQAADVVVANILAGPLHELAPRLATLVNVDGDLVLAGILAEQASNLFEHYLTWFDMQPIVTRDGWARLSGTRRSRK